MDYCPDVADEELHHQLRMDYCLGVVELELLKVQLDQLELQQQLQLAPDAQYYFRRSRALAQL